MAAIGQVRPLWSLGPRRPLARPLATSAGWTEKDWRTVRGYGHCERPIQPTSRPRNGRHATFRTLVFVVHRIPHDSLALGRKRAPSLLTRVSARSRGRLMLRHTGHDSVPSDSAAALGVMTPHPLHVFLRTNLDREHATCADWPCGARRYDDALPGFSVCCHVYLRDFN